MYFKFKNIWLKSESFVDRVKQWWSSFYFQGTQSHILAFKLKDLKVNLRVWVFGNVERKKKLLFKVKRIK